MDLQESLGAYHKDTRAALSHLRSFVRSLEMMGTWLFATPSYTDIPPGLGRAMEGLFASNAKRPLDYSLTYRAVIRGAREINTAGIEVGDIQYVSVHASVFSLVHTVLCGIAFSLPSKTKQRQSISANNFPASVDLSGMELLDVQAVCSWFSVNSRLPKDADELLELFVLLDLEYAAALDQLPEPATQADTATALPELLDSKKDGLNGEWFTWKDTTVRVPGIRQKLLRLLWEAHGRKLPKESICNSLWPDGWDETKLTTTVNRLKNDLARVPWVPKLDAGGVVLTKRPE